MGFRVSLLEGISIFSKLSIINYQMIAVKARELWRGYYTGKRAAGGKGTLADLPSL